MWSSSVHASSSEPSRDNEMRHGAPVCATDSSMWMVSGPGAMAVTSPENWLSCAPQGPFLMPVSELRAVGHAKREWDGEASESSMRAWRSSEDFRLVWGVTFGWCTSKVNSGGGKLMLFTASVG